MVRAARARCHNLPSFAWLLAFCAVVPLPSASLRAGVRPLRGPRLGVRWCLAACWPLVCRMVGVRVWRLGSGGEVFVRRLLPCLRSFLYFLGILYRMAKVSYLNVPSGMEAAYKKGLQSGDRFTFSRVRVKDLFLSRARVKGITQKSYLVSLAPVWQSLTDGQRALWSAAGAACGLTGWKMFVTDTVDRRKAGISGYALPNATYQAMVGRIEIVAPATGLLIEQAHPDTYYVNHHIVGTRSQYIPVAVNEPFSFPLEIAISWHTDLTAAGVSPRARFFCIVYSSYQGRTLEEYVQISFGLTDAWQRASATLSAVTGPVQGYSAFIELYNVRGNLYFDNVEIKHGGENWARDPACNNVAQSFTKAFQQVERHWAPLNISDGADFGSFYFS